MASRRSLDGWEIALMLPMLGNPTSIGSFGILRSELSLPPPELTPMRSLYFFLGITLMEVGIYPPVCNILFTALLFVAVGVVVGYGCGLIAAGPLWGHVDGGLAPRRGSRL